MTCACRASACPQIRARRCRRPLDRLDMAGSWTEPSLPEANTLSKARAPSPRDDLNFTVVLALRSLPLDRARSSWYRGAGRLAPWQPFVPTKNVGATIVDFRCVQLPWFLPLKRPCHRVARQPGLGLTGGLR